MYLFKDVRHSRYFVNIFPRHVLHAFDCLSKNYKVYRKLQNITDLMNSKAINTKTHTKEDLFTMIL